MTIRLLARHDKYTANTIVTLDAATEAGRVAAKQATADLTGGVPYVAPPAAPNQLYPLQVAVDASGNSVGVVGFNNQSVSLGGGGPGSVAIAGTGDSLTFGKHQQHEPGCCRKLPQHWLLGLDDAGVGRRCILRWWSELWHWRSNLQKRAGPFRRQLRRHEGPWCALLHRTCGHERPERPGRNGEAGGR